ncbi:MAG TPA: hypothetical protein P5307_15465 [Pirellulaceae bacterium]|nr:hypothetical protein [Planctomycetales bacterium]HRX80467.1 hypothetical protein [Pirellulaceae bacterium]
MNPYYHGHGIFEYDPARHAETKIGGARYAVGSFLREATIGRFGGLAVFNRALPQPLVSVSSAKHIRFEELAFEYSHGTGIAGIFIY